MNKNETKMRVYHDIMDPARAVAMHNMLSLLEPLPRRNSILRPFWYQIYFWDVHPPSDLGLDGHPKLGDFIPNLGLPRRMWAGGEINFLNEIILGIDAKKVSTIDSVEKKIGKSGPLAFVTEKIDIIQRDILCVREYKKLVYRQEFKKSTENISYKTTTKVAHEEKRVSFTTTDLYRYSGLTFNGHRIHYDRDYSKNIEGYSGLVVHGPLLAQYLIDFAENTIGSIKEFEFKGVSPLFDFEEAILCQKKTKTGVDLWIKNADDKLCMTASAK